MLNIVLYLTFGDNLNRSSTPEDNGGLQQILNDSNNQIQN